MNTQADDNALRRIADYEKISGWLWIGLAVVQILTVFGALAGVWNLLAGISRLKMSTRILERDPTVPEAYQGLAQLVILAVINALIGGFIGVLFVGFDLYVRDKVLSQAELFGGPQGAAVASVGLPASQVHEPRDVIDHLERLAALLRSGALTQAEFETQKALVLGA